ncbi:MAG: ATP-binding domain-containing protein [Myxococcota bacterium]
MPADPSATDPIVTDELTQLTRVRTLLDEVPYVAPPRESDIVAELVRLRSEIPVAKAEDKPAMIQQYEQSHAWLQQLRASRAAPEVDPDSPYFAHLRLTEGPRTRDVFIGKATRIARGVRIVDWRNAPISRLFYAYAQGDEYEEELGGQVHEGEVAARRTVTIRRGELERIDAPEGTFQRAHLPGHAVASPGADADAAWIKVEREPARLAGGEGQALRAHGVGEGQGRRLGTDLAGNRRRSDKRLPDIAGLIDPEQFALITRPSSGFVVIRGTAGSGKTTVALHRIAYLAYQDPSIDSGRTLFVVFSVALREYVSHVLPALGVHQVQIRDFRSWAAELRRRHFPSLPQKIREDAPAAVVRLKLHPVMAKVLETQVARQGGLPTAEQAIDDFASALTDLELLTRVFTEHDPSAFSGDELERVTTWCRDRMDELTRWAEGDEDADPALDVEDDALLLFAWQLRVGPLKSRGAGPLAYRHVAVDEVQDFSPLEVRVLLGCLDEHRSITLAGDTQQHVMKDAGFTSWAGFFAHLGLEGTEVDTLKIAYRSSEPIVTFAREVLGELAEDDEWPLVTRTGPAVELFRFTDPGAAVAFLGDALKELVRDEPLASVAVLSPSPELSALYADGLARAEVPRLRRVVAADFTFAPGVEVTEIANVKGLEFDYVVLVEVSAAHYPDVPAARRLLHVGATRAVHQLWLVTVGTPSPVLPDTIR